MKNNRITVIGGGPAGLAAAISAARNGVGVNLLETQSEVGRKLLSTGNGRCNISNLDAEGVDEVKSFFSDMGIVFYEESGRLYPYSEQALSVRDIMEEAAVQAGVQFVKGMELEALNYDDLTFYTTVEKGARICEFDEIILATGGKAAPQLGGNDSGLKLAKALGHNIVSPLPGLVAFIYSDDDKDRLKDLKGVRAKAKADLCEDGEIIASSRGEVQFTEYGLSGICIFDLSLHVRGLDKDKMEIVLDLAPDFDEDEILKADLRSLVQLKLLPILSKKNIKNFHVKVNGTKGWKEAQVMSGGIDLKEVNLETMESKLVPGLYFAGEILNYTEKCGGYNLNWACLSGIRAGKAVADRYK